MAMTERSILGLMSGSSLDGVDMACVKFWGDSTASIQWELMAKPLTLTYPENIKSHLDLVHTLPEEALEKFHRELGDFFGKVAKEYLDANQLKVSAIASHGHTVKHNPAEGYSIQIGAGDAMAKSSGLPCITDFRTQDIIHGGQGAPIAPVVEHYLFEEYKMFLNIGGISNISMHATQHIIGYDVCPANQLLNHLANQLNLPFDDGGRIAEDGSVDDLLLASLQADAYHRLEFPKSLDNNYVRSNFISKLDSSRLSTADKLATCTHYIANNISKEINRISSMHKIKEVFVTGGGAYNTFLLRLLSLKIGDVQLIVPRDEIIQQKESILLALCGYLYMEGLPNSFASATGASKDTINGIWHSLEKS